MAKLFAGVNRGRSGGGMGRATNGSTPLSPAVNGVAATLIGRAHNADRKFITGNLSQPEGYTFVANSELEKGGFGCTENETDR